MVKPLAGPAFKLGDRVKIVDYDTAGIVTAYKPLYSEERNASPFLYEVRCENGAYMRDLSAERLRPVTTAEENLL